MQGREVSPVIDHTPLKAKPIDWTKFWVIGGTIAVGLGAAVEKSGIPYLGLIWLGVTGLAIFFKLSKRWRNINARIHLITCDGRSNQASSKTTSRPQRTRRGESPDSWPLR
jgi:hypothetical protein